MTALDPASRRAGAAAAIARLIEILRGHGPGAETWYLMLSDMRDLLDDPDVSDHAALSGSSAMFDSLYSAPRNFSDFHIWRDDEDERIRANRELDNVTDDLRQNLSWHPSGQSSDSP